MARGLVNMMSRIRPNRRSLTSSPTSSTNDQTLYATIYVRILFVVVLFSSSISILNKNFDMRVSRDKADAAAEGVYSVDIFVSDPMEYPNAAFAYADLIDAGLLKVTH